jgi:hypothetical protein
MGGIEKEKDRMRDYLSSVEGLQVGLEARPPFVEGSLFLCQENRSELY